MSTAFPNGYNLLGCSLQGKNGILTLSDLEGYTCFYCKCILREACQLISCGHRLCKLCIPATAFNCSLCAEKVDPTSKEAFFNDRRCQRDLKEFKVLCKCGEEHALDPWEAHSETCQALIEVKPKATPQETSQIVHKVRALEADSKSTKSQLGELRKESKECLKRTDSLEKELLSMKTVLEEVQRMVRPGGRQAAAGTGTASRHSSSDIQRINGKLSQLNEIMTQLVTDVEQHKGTIAQMSSGVDSVTAAIPRHDSILEELNLKIEILEVKSCTGIYVWKVNELGRRMREARLGRTMSLYSPPFYSSAHGYRVCLRAYLNGDGSGRGTHVSLYIVVMKSEYDDLLTWPFSHSVTLSLINQVDPLRADKSISHKFTPNPSSSSFQKPQDTFNIASGFPEFAPVSVLNDPLFAKNDTIYFRIKLDSPNTPSGPDEVNFH